MAGHVKRVRKGDPLETDGRPTATARRRHGRAGAAGGRRRARSLQRQADSGRLEPWCRVREGAYTRAPRTQRPMPKPTPEMLAMWGGEIFIFPNLMILPQAGNAHDLSRAPATASILIVAFSKSIRRRLIRRQSSRRARSCETRDRYRRSGAGAAHSAPGPRQHSAHAERTAFARYAPDLACESNRRRSS